MLKLHAVLATFIFATGFSVWCPAVESSYTDREQVGQTPTFNCANSHGGGGVRIVYPPPDPYYPPGPEIGKQQTGTVGTDYCNCKRKDMRGLAASVFEGTYASFVDNMALNHIHSAFDYKQAPPVGSCGSCGTAGKPVPELHNFELLRIHRYREMTEDSSFGPGCFSNFDTKIYLYIVNDSNVIDLFDPQAMNVSRFIDGPYSHPFYPNDTLDGVYTAFKTNSHKELRLLDVNGDPTTVQGNAVTAVLTSWTEQKFYFEIINVAGALCGRMTKIEDQTGYTFTIAYKYPAQGTSDLQWQIDTVTDPHGKTATFSYAAQQVSGRWVVDRVDFPNSTYATYGYTDGFLADVQFPDGTETTITRAFDSVSQCTAVTYFDAAAERTHRAKTAYLTNNFTVVPDLPDDIIPQSACLVRLIFNGDGEMIYKNVTNPWGYSFVYVFEANGLLKRIYCGWQAEYAKSWTWTKGNDPWSYWGIAADLETVFENLEYSSAYSYRKWYRCEPDAHTDEQGLRVTYTYNEAGNITSKTYPDSTSEAWEYDSQQKNTQHRDRDNRVTQYTYDSRGNILTKVVGLKFENNQVVTTPETATFTWTYFPQGNANQYLLQTFTDANGHATDYAYDSSQFLVSVTEAPDVNNGDRGVTTFAIDTVGRLHSVTDPIGRYTEYQYDSRNRVDQITYLSYPAYPVETFTYGTGANANLLVQQTDKNGNVTKHDYDLSGREVTTTYGFGSSVEVTKNCTYAYGADFRTVCVDKGDKTIWGYDYRNRLMATTVQPNSATQLTGTTVYTDNKVTSAVDPYNRKTFFVYDLNFRAIRMVRELVPNAIATNTDLTTLARDGSTNPSYVIEDTQYDSDGVVTARVDARGVKSTFGYDSRVQLTSQVEADQRWDGTSWQIVPEGAQTAFRYDAQGNRTKIIMPRSFARQTGGSFVAGPEGEFSTTFAYTNRNLLASKTEAAGLDQNSQQRPEQATESYTYNLDGRIATTTDGRGNVWTTKWRKCCTQVMAQLDPLCAVDTSGTNKYGTTVLGTDYANNPTYQGRATVTTPATITREWARNPDNDVTFNEVTTHFDERNRLDKRTVWLTAISGSMPTGPNCWRGDDGRGFKPGDSGAPGTGQYLLSQIRYDDDLTDNSGIDADYSTQLALLGNGFGTGSVGKAMETTNPAGEKSVIVYDGIGRIVLQIDGNGNSTKYVYDSVVNGLVETAVVDALGNTTRSRVDAVGRVRESVDALTKATAYVFDANGNLLQVRDPNSVGYDSTFDYRNRELTRTDTKPDVIFSRVYDGNSNVTAQTDSLSHTITFAYDARDRKVSTTDRISGVTSFAYDANNNLLSLTDAETKQTTYVYDPRNLLIAETFPLGQFADADTNNDGYPDARTRVYAYDAVRRLSSRLDQQLALTTYSYDFADRLLSRNYPDTANDTFTYDSANRLLTATSARYNNTVTRDYSSNNEKAGRLQAETLTCYGQSYTTGYGYAANNLQTAVVYPNGQAVARTFTARYQLATASFDGTTVAGTIVYDDGMRRTSLPFNNGRTEARNYRADNLVSAIAADGSTTSLAYAWDSNKRKTQENDAVIPNNVQNYTGYDNEDRLTGFNRSGLQTQAWTLSLVGDWSQFNDNGNVQNRTHDNVHELTAINANALTYDQKGNLTYNGNDGRYFVWDFENRLFETYTWDGDTTVNAYDALGRRVLHQVISNDWMTWTGTVYVSDGLQEIAEYPQFGNAASPQRMYVYGSYIDEPLCMIDNTGEAQQRYYYHANDLYSVAALTDSAGNVVERYKYDPYGKVTVLAADGATVRPASSYANPWTFTGRRLDAETGLMYYRSRFYAPDLGRFISRDPRGYESGLNVFEYCAGLPTEYTDPTGGNWVWRPRISPWTNPLTYVVFSMAGGSASDLLNGHWAHLPEPVTPGGPLTPAQIKSHEESLKMMIMSGSVAWYQVSCCCINLMPEIEPYVPLPRNPKPGSQPPKPAQAEKPSTGTSNPEVPPNAGNPPATPSGGAQAGTPTAPPTPNPPPSTKGYGNVPGGCATPEQVLNAAEKWLGPKPKQVAPGVFQSADGTRQFRMTDADLTGHKTGMKCPHVHFEELPPGGGPSTENSHVELIQNTSGKSQ